MFSVQGCVVSLFRGAVSWAAAPPLAFLSAHTLFFFFFPTLSIAYNTYNHEQ